jgi:hypothetical protein
MSNTPDPELVRRIAYQRYKAVAAKIEKLERLADPARNNNAYERLAANSKITELVVESMAEMAAVKDWLGAQAASCPPVSLPSENKWWLKIRGAVVWVLDPENHWNRIPWLIRGAVFWIFWLAIAALAIKEGLEKNVPPEVFGVNQYGDQYPDIDGP